MAGAAERLTYDLPLNSERGISGNLVFLYISKSQFLPLSNRLDSVPAVGEQPTQLVILLLRWSVNWYLEETWGGQNCGHSDVILVLCRVHWVHPYGTTGSK